MSQPTTITMAYGTGIFALTLTAWLYGSTLGIPTDMVWAVATPVILALFIAEQLGTTAKHAQRAADQTNGVLNDRIKSAVAGALADRDAARTRQRDGDIAENKPTEPEKNDAE